MKQWLIILAVLAIFFLAITGMFRLTMRLTSSDKALGMKESIKNVILIDNREASDELDAIKEWLKADVNINLSCITIDQTDTILRSKVDLVIVTGSVNDLFSDHNDINWQVLTTFMSEGGRVVEFALFQMAKDDCHPSARGMVLPVSDLQGKIPEASVNQLFSHYLIGTSSLSGEPLMLASRPNNTSSIIFSRRAVGKGWYYQSLVTPWQTAGRQWLLNRLVRFMLQLDQPVWKESVKSEVFRYAEVDSLFCRKYLNQKSHLSGSPEEVIDVLSWLRVAQPPMASQLIMAALKSSDIAVQEHAIRLLTNGNFRESLPLLKRLRREAKDQEKIELLNTSISKLSKPL